MIYFITDLHLQHYNVIKFTSDAINKPWQTFKYEKEWKDELLSLKTADDWDNLILQHWKEMLKDDPDAEVYILGDVILGNLDKGFEHLCELGKYAKLHLIKGNHDSKLLNGMTPQPKIPARFNYKDANIIPWKVYDCERENSFNYVFAVDYKELDGAVHHSKLVNGNAVLCHYPIIEWNHPTHNIMLYGHVHNNRSACEVDAMFRKGGYYKGEDKPILGKAINCGAMMPYMNWSPKTIDQLLESYNKMFNIGEDK